MLAEVTQRCKSGCFGMMGMLFSPSLFGLLIGMVNPKSFLLLSGRLDFSGNHTNALSKKSFFLSAAFARSLSPQFKLGGMALLRVLCAFPCISVESLGRESGPPPYLAMRLDWKVGRAAAAAAAARPPPTPHSHRGQSRATQQWRRLTVNKSGNM